MLTVRPDRVIWQRDDLQQRDSFEFEATLWQRTSETPDIDLNPSPPYVL
jgi:hypothetical protein